MERAAQKDPKVAKIPVFGKKRPKNLHQFGVRFTKKPMNFISAMSGSDGNCVMERAAIGKFGMSWHSTGPLK